MLGYQGVGFVEKEDALCSFCFSSCKIEKLGIGPGDETDEKLSTKNRKMAWVKLIVEINFLHAKIISWLGSSEPC